MGQHLACGLAALFLAAAEPASAQSCTKTMELARPPSRLALLASQFAGSPEARSAFVARLSQGNNVEWMCSDPASSCCRSIPVDITFDSNGACFVSFPYAKLSISTQGGTRRPDLVWRLQTSAVLPVVAGKYSFDDKIGIRIIALPGNKPPVERKGKLDDKDGVTFLRKNAGAKGDQAGHEPMVYPVDSRGQPDRDNPCSPLDPLIVNSD